MLRVRLGIFCFVAWVATAQAINVVQKPQSRDGVSLGTLPVSSNLLSLGLGVDSNIANAGIVAIALTAAAIITVLLLPGIQLSYGGNLLGEIGQSRQLLNFGSNMLFDAFQSRQFGLNGPGGVGLMTLFSVATDIYSKMDSDDVTCQKKVICEFMKDNKMFGTGANSVRTGIATATSFLSTWNIPYVDSIREAASLNDQSGRSCDELHPSCNHISLKESYDNSVKKVFAVTETSPTKNNTPRKEEEQPAEEDEEYEYYYDRK